jgi:aminoglycoside 3-N-acetyltransferase
MRKLASRLPRPVLDGARAARGRYRSARYRARERLRPVRIDRGQIESALREAGLREGDAAFVQAGMSSFGTIEGGPQTVIDAVRAVVGAGALIVMPAFPMERPGLVYLRENPIFDLRNTPSRMGAVSERFRTLPGVERSLHPTHSVCAQGPGARDFAAGHERAETPFGPATPFERMVGMDAQQLFLGTGTRPLTAYHVFECLREPPDPYGVFWPERLAARCIDADGAELTVSTLVHLPELVHGRIDQNPSVEALMRERLIEAGMRSVELGRSQVLAQSLPEMLAAFEALLDLGVSMYSPETLAEVCVA